MATEFTIFQQMHVRARHFATMCFGPRMHLLFLESAELWLSNCQSNRMKRTSNRVPYDGSDDLTIYIHDGATSFRFEIEGSLSGNGARQLEQSWCTASSVIRNRSLVIAVGKVNRIDPFGRALLRRLHEAGARFVATSPLANTLVGSITGQPVVFEMAATKHDTWLRFRVHALPLIPLITPFFPATVNAASLEPTTSKAWQSTSSLQMCEWNSA
jgi:hypothetical protein